jgi:hypothetical protein
MYGETKRNETKRNETKRPVFFVKWESFLVFVRSLSWQINGMMVDFHEEVQHTKRGGGGGGVFAPPPPRVGGGGRPFFAARTRGMVPTASSLPSHSFANSTDSKHASVARTYIQIIDYIIM